MSCPFQTGENPEFQSQWRDEIWWNLPVQEICNFSLSSSLPPDHRQWWMHWPRTTVPKRCLDPSTADCRPHLNISGFHHESWETSGQSAELLLRNEHVRVLDFPGATTLRSRYSASTPICLSRLLNGMQTKWWRLWCSTCSTGTLRNRSQSTCQWTPKSSNRHLHLQQIRAKI